MKFTVLLNDKGQQYASKISLTEKGMIFSPTILCIFCYYSIIVYNRLCFAGKEMKIARDAKREIKEAKLKVSCGGEVEDVTCVVNGSIMLLKMTLSRLFKGISINKLRVY